MKPLRRLLAVLAMPPGTLGRLIRQRLTGRKYIVTGSCRCCGKCCRNINLKYHKGWIRRREQFEELLELYPEYSRFSVVSRSGEGFLEFSCVLYDPERGCTDYPHRPAICRNYPGSSLALHGGSLLEDCGYTISEGVPFQKRLDREMKRK